MKCLNINLILFLCILLLSCNNSTKRKPGIKTIEQINKTNEITVNKKGIIGTKSELKSIPTKQKKTIGTIRICNTQIGYNDTLALRNTIEYHLNNGIIYVKEFYPDKKIKSESYWINKITPVYKIIQYKQVGKIKRIINKRSENMICVMS